MLRCDVTCHTVRLGGNRVTRVRGAPPDRRAVERMGRSGPPPRADPAGARVPGSALRRHAGRAAAAGRACTTSRWRPPRSARRRASGSPPSPPSARTPRRASRTPAASPIATWCASAPVTRRERLTPSSPSPSRRRSSSCCRCARTNGSPSSPSAAAPAWSAGSSRCAAGSRRSSRSTCPGLDRLVNLDIVSHTATLQPGLRGPQAEALLNARGYTLGHFPQSYELATIGGYAATRSAGQASTGYGRSDELVVGLTVATPAGTLRLGRAPRSAAGPDLRQLMLGSEGAFGVITDVTMAVRPVPAHKRYEAWFFPTFAAGVDALRRARAAQARARGLAGCRTRTRPWPTSRCPVTAAGLSGAYLKARRAAGDGDLRLGGRAGAGRAPAASSG